MIREVQTLISKPIFVGGRLWKSKNVLVGQNQKLGLDFLAHSVLKQQFIAKNAENPYKK